MRSEGIRITASDAQGWVRYGCGRTDSSSTTVVSDCTDLLAAQVPLLPRVLAALLPAMYDILFPPQAGTGGTGSCATYPAAASTYRLRGSDGGVAAGGTWLVASGLFAALSVVPNGLWRLISCQLPGRTQPETKGRKNPPLMPPSAATDPPPHPQSCTSNRVLNIVFYLNATMRGSLVSVILRGSTDQRRVPTALGGVAASDAWWLRPGGSRVVGDALWVRPLDWNADLMRDLAVRNRAEVCLELRPGVSLPELCLGGVPGTCFASLVSSDSCCPVYSAAMA
ncbi:hypothetical protein TSOC_009772 [Tetrabaena socialis]|uniref:Uncharacterized protein n=1 Tax=Tetrabaena socialis TaxID=47790 RepID=A0A2J7ZUZ0_9CHLO|nr:hypothetical protein TSOC_009772 [Tetrabaena socialis]|eukprot:PNH04097.1 hypothetical protein TSOC_009772 [Tetrabaena socialis]